MKWLARFRVFLIVSVAIILIVAAVLFSTLRAVLPFATGYQTEIQQEISRQIGLPIEIGSLDAAIHRFSPALKLINVSIFDERNKVPLFNFEEAFVELDVIASLLHGEPIIADIGLIGTDISIERLDENRWTVQGVEFSRKGESALPESFQYMLLNSSFQFHDCNIYYRDLTGQKLSLALLDVNIDIHNDFGEHDIRFSMRLPESYGESIHMVAKLQGDLEDMSGELYLEGKSINLHQFNKKFRLIENFDIQGITDVSLWFELDAVDEYVLTSQLQAGDFILRNIKSRQQWQTGYLATNVNIERDADEWTLQVSDLVFGEVKKPAWPVTVDLVAGSDEQGYYINSSFIRVSDILSLAKVVATDEQRDYLKQADGLAPEADIYNLSLQLGNDLTADGIRTSLVARGSVNDAAINDSKHGVRIEGLDFDIKYAPDKIQLSLASSNTAVTFGSLFRKPLFADWVAGEIAIGRQNQDGSDQWTIRSDQLQISNAHIQTYSRLHLDIDNGGGILADIQSDFYNADAEFTSQYLPVGIMSESLVSWLDKAIIDGQVTSGSFLLFGRLSDFPYRNHEGIFQAFFDARDVELNYQQGWPELEKAKANVRFENESLSVRNVMANTAGIPLSNGRATITDLKHPVIKVSADASSDNSQLQSYVWNSGLDDILGNALRLFQLEGRNSLAFNLDIPLKKEKIEVAVNGQLNLVNASLYYPALGYELQAVNGVIEFTNDTIFADNIEASVQGRKLKIKAFRQEDANKDAYHVFNVTGPLEADYLLHNYDWLPGDWVSGASGWNIDITVPVKKAETLVNVIATSDLQGTKLNISDQVKKQKSGKLPVNLNIKILDESNIQLEAIMGHEKDPVVDLFATRTGDLRWVFDVDSSYVAGRGEFNGAFTRDTRIKLNLESIDLYALFHQQGGTAGSNINPSTIPPIDFNSTVVKWQDWTFNDVKLNTSWHEHGMLIDTISLHGVAFEIDARGTWLSTWRGNHETVLQGDISSQNCGDSLASLGFERSVDRCRFKATFDTKWPAEPYRISWANMKGKTRFEMSDGVIPEVDPGAGGRLLGLLNLFKLTNRLKLNFADVTERGFAFDKISGNFEFLKGDGSLDNFNVSAPAADITMFGKIGLVEHDYGLLVHVKPHTSTITFAGGTLIGGVVVGAGLALVQNLLNLDIITHDVYSITGSWDNPVIEKIVESSDESWQDDDF